MLIYWHMLDMREGCHVGFTRKLVLTVAKPKILIIHDTEIKMATSPPLRWAYAHRSASLVRYAPGDLEIHRCAHREIAWRRIHEYQLIFALDYAIASGYRTELNRLGLSTPLVVSFNKDSKSRHALWEDTLRAADLVVCNNYDRYTSDGIHPKTVCITNGVDTEDWFETTPIQDRPHKVLWVGSSGPAKKKRYHELISQIAVPLDSLGFECHFRPINDITPQLVYPTNRQRDWYNGGSYVLCASETEGGGPGFLNEAVACGCVAVTVPVGSVPEWAVHRENAVIVKPTIAAFIDSLVYARNNRDRLSAAGQAAMQQWSYGPPGNRAQYFYQLFRRIINDGVKSIKSFCWRDISPEEI